MSRNINDFPAEVLRLVLQEVKRQSRLHQDGSFLDALVTCQLWNQIGEEILYTDIHLTNPQLLKFEQAPKHCLEMTRSLSLTISAPEYKEAWIEDYEPPPLDPGMEWEEYNAMRMRCKHELRDAWFARNEPVRAREYCELWDQFAKTSAMLNSMQRLESFSLVSDMPPPETVHHVNYPNRGKTIRTLLEALPPSVRNLELDTDEADDWFRQEIDEENHICLSLKVILPRLDNARIKMAKFCEALLPTEGSKSESNLLTASRAHHDSTLVLNTVGASRDGKYTSNHCNCSSPEAFFGTLVPPVSDPKITSISDLLVAKLQVAISHGCLDNFQQFVLLDLKIPENAARRYRRQYQTMQVRTLGQEQKTELSPYFMLIALPPQSNLTSDFHAVRHINDKLGEVEVIGWLDTLIRYVEGETWIETEYGCRLAVGYFGKNSRFTQVRLKPLPLYDQNSMPINLLRRPKLWEMEERRQCTFLSGQIWEDLDHSGCVSRELTPKEVVCEANGKAIMRGEVDEDRKEVHPPCVYCRPSIEDLGSGSESEFGRDHDEFYENPEEWE